jgi:glutathione peroxidase
MKHLLYVNILILSLAIPISFVFAQSTEPVRSFHDFAVKDIEGKTVKLKDFKGKVLLVVNTASRCGFTLSIKI